MADHPPITPDEIARAVEVYRSTGSYAEAARAIGRDRSATRKALRRAAEPQRATLLTRALEDAFGAAVDATQHTMRELRRDARHAKKPADRVNAAYAINDAARTLNQMRVAHAKLTGEHAAERHELAVTSLSDADLDARIRELEGEPG